MAGGRELPGADLVEEGLRDLAGGIESAHALLVSIAAPRLRLLGVAVPATLSNPEHRLYDLLMRENPDTVYGRYNALLRRIVSYERALACAR
jgi:hypothetical protein